MNERKIFSLITENVLNIQKRKEKPVRIAINGIQGTGKTVFAEKLTNHLNLEKIKTIQVSIDGFHFNKKKRYKQGRHSAKGYYEDSYNELAFIEKVLESSQSDFPNYTIATHNLKTDKYLNLEPIELENNSVLITDGAYLFKPNYRDYWDFKIYLKTNFETAMNRGIKRDKNSLEDFETIKERYEKRYHKASRIYLTENRPEEIADIVIDNSDFDNLRIIKNTTANNG